MCVRARVYVRAHDVSPGSRGSVNAVVDVCQAESSWRGGGGEEGGKKERERKSEEEEEEGGDEERGGRDEGEWEGRGRTLSFVLPR